MKTVNGCVSSKEKDLVVVPLSGGSGDFVRYVEVSADGTVSITDVDENDGARITSRTRLVIPNVAGAGKKLAKTAVDATVKDEDEAWYLRRSPDWEKRTGKKSGQHARVYVEETGKVLDLPGPNCCAFCGAVWVESQMEQWACANCGAI